MNFLEFMVKTPFRERAAVAAKLGDGARTSRSGKKFWKLPRANWRHHETREVASVDIHTSARALVTTAKGEGAAGKTGDAIEEHVPVGHPGQLITPFNEQAGYSGPTIVHRECTTGQTG